MPSLNQTEPDVLVVGGGNAALCAAMTAREAGADVLLLESAPEEYRGGNSRHTRNLRYLHNRGNDFLTGPYSDDEFWDDLWRVTGGLLYFKFSMDTRPAPRGTFGMDVAFITLLWLTAFTGILLLILRATPMMGTLLTMHLGMVAGLFLSIPYSKFVHGVYCYAALVRNAAEQEHTKQ